MKDLVIDRRAKGYRDFEGVMSCDLSMAKHKSRVVEDLPLKGHELFDMIFSVNPLTGLPQGDLAMFMNENTSPEVRQYISQNLMSDNSAGVAPTVKASDADSIPDDVIVELSRRDGESLGSYRDRMIDYVKSQASLVIENGKE